MVKKETLRKSVLLAAVLAILFMLYAMVSAARYTVLLGDDFVHGVQIDAFHVPLFQYLRASWEYMLEMYRTWQGTYFSMFIQALLSPINNFGMDQLRIVMIANAVLLFISFIFALWEALGYLWPDRKMAYVKMPLIAIFLFAILDSAIYTEIFFWYSGAVAYSIPLSFMFLGIAFLLMANKKEKYIGYTILASLCIFAAMGGSLTVAGACGCVILLLCVSFYMVQRKLSIPNCVVAAIGIIGGIIAVAAPGNFARHDETAGAGLRPFMAGKYAIKLMLTESERLIKHTMTGVILLAIIVLGIYLAERMMPVFREYGIVSVMALFAPVIVAFPVFLGYGGNYVPNRCQFVVDVILLLGMLNFAFFIGCCLRKWCDIGTDKKTLAILLFIVTAAFILCEESVSESPVMKVAQNARSGLYREYYEECCALYERFENAPEQELVIEAADFPEFIDDFECFYMDKDPTKWVNNALAIYYGKESIILNW